MFLSPFAGGNGSAVYAYFQRKKVKRLSYQLKKLKRAARRARIARSKLFTRGTAPSIDYFGADRASANDLQKLRRTAMQFKGRGDYRDVLRSIGKYGSRAIGAASGAMMGALGGKDANSVIAGGRSGWDAGADFSKYMGWGDYGPVSKNQIMGGGEGSQQQISVNQFDESGDIFLSHTEFVQNISCTASGAGASGFQFVKFSINPGLVATFPWLSQIAENFVLYEFQGLIFQFKPTSGENNATSNSLGKVILATQYDPDAPDFLNSVQMENYDYANSAKPSVGILHGVETANQQQYGNMQYIRTGTSTKDKIFTDIGSLYVATEGVPFAAAGTQILGELWVSYRIKLSRANLFGSLIGQTVSQDFFTVSGSAVSMLISSTAKSTNSLGATLSNINATSMKITFPANIVSGNYRIDCYGTWPASATTRYDAVLSGLTNAITYFPMSSLTGFTGFYAPGAPAAANTTGMVTYYIQISAPGNLQATLNINLAGASLGAWTQYVSITESPYIVNTTLT